jgi:hypothetical protein
VQLSSECIDTDSRISRSRNALAINRGMHVTVEQPFIIVSRIFLTLMAPPKTPAQKAVRPSTDWSLSYFLHSHPSILNLVVGFTGTGHICQLHLCIAINNNAEFSPSYFLPDSVRTCQLWSAKCCLSASSHIKLNNTLSHPLTLLNWMWESLHALRHSPTS